MLSAMGVLTSISASLLSLAVFYHGWDRKSTGFFETLRSCVSFIGTSVAADVRVDQAGANLLGHGGVLLRGKGEADLVAGDGQIQCPAPVFRAVLDDPSKKYPLSLTWQVNSTTFSRLSVSGSSGRAARMAA